MMDMKEASAKIHEASIQFVDGAITLDDFKNVVDHVAFLVDPAERGVMMCVCGSYKFVFAKAIIATQDYDSVEKQWDILEYDDTDEYINHVECARCKRDSCELAKQHGFQLFHAPTLGVGK